MQLTKNTKFHNRYRLVEKKGSGSFGEVWLARDEQLDNMEVAIKVYIALDDRGVADFKSEYRTTFGLSHPNLLHAYQFDLCDNRPYLVMPYCPDSAASLVGRADEITIWYFIRDVASGLAYLHDLYIVHHDIKPDNVLIDGQGNFLITDFGISTRLRTTLQRNSSHNATGPKGSLPYMAPELFDLSAGAVLASDIWALGATLYEMASGELPFFGQGGAMLRNGATISRPNLPYSEGLIDTILECLKKEPWERPRAIDLAQRAQNVIDGHPYQSNHDKPKDEPVPPIDTETPDSLDNPYGFDGLMSPRVKPKAKKTWLWPMAVVATLAIGMVVWWFVLRTKPSGDKEFYAYCVNNPTIENYRAYVKQFPKGDFIPLALFWIEEWEKDSVSVALSNNQKLDNNSKDGQKPKDNREQKEAKDKKVDEKIKTKVAPEVSENEKKPDLRPLLGEPTPNDEIQLTPAQPKTQNAEEEAYKRCLKPDVSIEDCLYWMEMYGDSKTRDKDHWGMVIQVFRQLYAKKLKDCKTYGDYKNFLDEHDRIMKRARLTGSSIDQYMRKEAEERMHALRP